MFFLFYFPLAFLFSYLSAEDFSNSQESFYDDEKGMYPIEMPSWVQYTNFEQKLIGLIVEVEHGECFLEDFNATYQEELQRYAALILFEFEPTLLKAICSNKNQKMKIKGMQYIAPSCLNK